MLELTTYGASDYNLVTPLRLCKIGKLEVTQFFAPTTSGTISVFHRSALLNTSMLTAPDNLALV